MPTCPAGWSPSASSDVWNVLNRKNPIDSIKVTVRVRRVLEADHGCLHEQAMALKGEVHGELHEDHVPGVFLDGSEEG